MASNTYPLCPQTQPPTFGFCSLGMLLFSQGGVLGLFFIPLPACSALPFTSTVLHFSFCLWDQNIQENPGAILAARNAAEGMEKIKPEAGAIKMPIGKANFL